MENSKKDNTFKLIIRELETRIFTVTQKTIELYGKLKFHPLPVYEVAFCK
jgi:hypothetical protein